jgi:DNA invertase Pin-like site-specific DNA recombinase
MSESRLNHGVSDVLIGYARVSTHEQDVRLQVEALEAAGCTKIFTDEGVTGAAVIKPELVKALAYARADEDTLVVWKLDRLSRSMRDLIETVQAMKARGIGLRSIKEAVIDTSSAAGNLIFQIFGAFAEFERGTNHAKARELFKAEPPARIADIATLLGVSRQAIYRRLERENLSLPD